MYHTSQKNEVRETVLILSVFINAIILEQGLVSHKNWYWWLLITIPFLLLSVVFFRNKTKAKHRTHSIPETMLDLDKISFQ